jgi:hypothetical protein
VLSHPDRSIRHTAGSLVSTVAAAGGLAAWPELVMALGHSLGSSEAPTLDGALDTMYKISEDSIEQVGGCFRVGVGVGVGRPVVAVAPDPHIWTHRRVCGCGCGWVWVCAVAAARAQEGRWRGAAPPLPPRPPARATDAAPHLPPPPPPAHPTPQMNAKVEGATWGSPQSVSVLLVPPLLALLGHPSADARKGALKVLNLMLPFMPDGMLDNIGGRPLGGLVVSAIQRHVCVASHLNRAFPPPAQRPTLPTTPSCPPESFTQGLFNLATDTDSGVRKQVVAGLVGLLPIRPDLLMPQLHQIIEYMLAMHQVGGGRGPGGSVEAARWRSWHAAGAAAAAAPRPVRPTRVPTRLPTRLTPSPPCTPRQDGDEDVALESAEFWVAFCDADDLEPELLRPFLPRLIPLLLDKMVFEEYDEEVQVAGVLGGGVLGWGVGGPRGGALGREMRQQVGL